MKEFEKDFSLNEEGTEELNIDVNSDSLESSIDIVSELESRDTIDIDNDTFEDDIDEDQESNLSAINHGNNIMNMENEIVDMFDRDYSKEDLEDEMEIIDVDSVVMDEVIYDSKGNPINSQIDGELKMQYVPLDEILIPPRGKLFVDDISDLEESIQFWGLVEPVHLVPYKDKYFLLHGYRRYLAYRNLGFDVIPSLVDTTRPKEVIRYLEVVANNTRKYNFIEMMRIGEFIEERQKSFSHDTIENILGLPSGMYLKAKYIEAAKTQFDDIYNKVVKNKMSIEQAFKKIEKELNKEDDDMSPLDHLNQFGLNDYGKVEEEVHVQQSGERHPLDPALRKYVEGRDMHSCQSCGMGLGEPDLASIFHVHHMIPVKHGGPDKKGNLILLCPNCHGYVHAYEEGKFKPSNEMVEEYDTIYNIILLGNIVKRGLPSDYGGEAFDFYMERVKQYWLEDEEN